MRLFKKEKDLVLKITNLALLLWLVGSLVLLYVSIINLIMPTRELTYKEYKVSNCYYGVPEDDKDKNDTYCQSSYEAYQRSNKDAKYQTKRNIFYALGSAVIGAGVMLLLNKEKGDHK